MHNSRVNKNTQAVWLRGNPSRKRSAPEQREQIDEIYKHHSGDESTVPSGFILPTKQVDTPFLLEIDPLTGAEVSKECPKSCFVNDNFQPPIYSEVLPDHTPSGYGRAVGNRRHFRYSPYSSAPPSYQADSEEEEDGDYEAFVSKSCVSALGNIIGRRIARAMVDLIGVEPNPGPGGKKKTKARAVRLALVPTKTAKRMVKIPAIPRGMKYMDDVTKYMCVLSDPWSCEPLRLGGEMMQPSAIASLTYKGIYTLSGTGQLSMVLYPRSSQPILSSVTASAPYTYTASGVFSSGASLASVALGARIISAGVRVESVNSSQTDQGIAVAGCLPREVALNTTSNLTTSGLPYSTSTTATQGFNEFNNYSQTEIFPLRDGFSCVYRPMDPIDFTFRDTLVTVPNGYVADEPLSPFLVVGISGAAANATVMVEYTVHLEYTVNEGFTGVVNQEQGVLTTPELAKAAVATFQNATNTATPGGKSTWFDSIKNFGKSALPYVADFTGRALAAYSGRSSTSNPYHGKSFSLGSGYNSGK
jgi:hypothetical protein